MVLERIVEYPTIWLYGYELSRVTGLKFMTHYPILKRHERYALPEACWVATGDGVPPRQAYRLTPKGLKLTEAKLAEARPRSLVREQDLV